MIKYKSLIWILTGILIAPLIFYLFNFGSWTFSDNHSDWGTFGDYINGVLSPLISIITLGITAYIAYSFNEYEKRRDGQSKVESDIKSYLELYQYFVGTEFREKRHCAWNVIRRALEYPEYANFIVKENYIIRYTERESYADIFRKFKYLYKKDKFRTKQEFLHKESEDRHKLDSVINFFQLLAVVNVPKDNYQICDFYYDSWRPMLCWYTKKLEEGYNKSEINLRYNNPPNLRTTINLLDKRFYHSKKKDKLAIENIEEHPILEWYLKRKQN